jgi:hypothetical protein
MSGTVENLGDPEATLLKVALSSLCLPDGSPITRDRVIKGVRGGQRIAGIEQGVHMRRGCAFSWISLLRYGRVTVGVADDQLGFPGARNISVPVGL